MNAKILGQALFFSFTICSLTACGALDDEDAPESGESFDKRIAELIAENRCDRIFNCPSTQTERSLRRFRDIDHCKEVNTDELFAEHNAQKGVEAGYLSYDAAAGQACIAKLKSTYESTGCGEIDFIESPRECEQVFKGTLTLGEPCLVSDYCADGLQCVKEDAQVCGGRCQAQPCAACTQDQRCVQEDQRVVCVDHIALGAACTKEDTCIYGSSCFFNGAETGSCLAHKSIEDGGACDLGENCKSTSCVDSICVMVPPAFSPQVNGESCTYSADQCGPGLSCQDVDPSSEEGQCKPVLPSGADCDVNIQCEYGLICAGVESGVTRGKCSPRLANGETCQSSSQCQSNECDGVCVEPTPKRCAP